MKHAEKSRSTNRHNHFTARKAVAAAGAGFIALVSSACAPGQPRVEGSKSTYLTVNDETVLAKQASAYAQNLSSRLISFATSDKAKGLWESYDGYTYSGAFRNNKQGVFIQISGLSGENGSYNTSSVNSLALSVYDKVTKDGVPSKEVYSVSIGKSPTAGEEINAFYSQNSANAQSVGLGTNLKGIKGTPYYPLTSEGLMEIEYQANTALTSINNGQNVPYMLKVSTSGSGGGETHR